VIVEKVASNFLSVDFGFRVQPSRNMLTIINNVPAKISAMSTRRQPKQDHIILGIKAVSILVKS
jgi:hypothetical protein